MRIGGYRRGFETFNSERRHEAHHREIQMIYRSVSHAVVAVCRWAWLLELTPDHNACRGTDVIRSDYSRSRKLSGVEESF